MIEMAHQVVVLQFPERRIDDQRPAPGAATRSDASSGLWQRKADPHSLPADPRELRERGFYVRPTATDRIALALFVDGEDLNSGCLYCPDWSASGSDLDCINAFARHQRTDDHRARRWRARLTPQW